MSIYAQDGLFQLNTRHTSYQFAVDRLGVLVHTYYGARIPNESLYQGIALCAIGFSGSPADAGDDRAYSLDTLPQEVSCAGVGDYRDAMLAVRHTDGSTAADLRYHSHKVFPGALELPGLPALRDTDGHSSQTLVITLRDVCTPLEVQLVYGVFPAQDIITRSLIVENRGQGPVTLTRALSLNLDLPQTTEEWDMVAFAGRHAMERQPERRQVGRIKCEIGSLRGASSHQYNPAFLLCHAPVTETMGECYGFCFVYSGNFIANAQQDQTGRIRVLLGIHPEQFAWEVPPGGSFTAPQALLCYSGQGLGRLSRCFHDVMREHLCRDPYGVAPRPLLLNSWEAAYFHFDRDKLLTLARQAAGLGIELLVLDDGWFGHREDDTTSLGDWYANEGKLGGSLGSLGEEISRLGLRFGLWVEPEMISEDSDLYRAHPDWAIAIPGRAPNRSRAQLVLDITRREVRVWLLQRLEEILASAPIDYLKWDMNRSLCDVYSCALPPQRMGEFYHRYTLAVYDLLEHLLRRFPKLFIEGCSGGGGRFDAGMLYYTPQIWCSDNTDAIDRSIIQYGTSFFYPPCAMGAHVSACPNEQTRRSVPLATRAAVASAGAFGYELDPARLDSTEQAAIRAQARAYHAHYALLRTGDYHRLTGLDGPFIAWAFAAKDRSRMLVTVVQTERHAYGWPPIVPLRALEPAARYRSSLDGRVLSGSAWVAGGLPLPHALAQYEAVQVLLERLPAG